MPWLQLGGSIAAIVALAGISWVLGLGRATIADEPAAIRAAEDALSGFTGARGVIGSDGRAALVYGTDGGIAVLKLHGARIATRLVAADAVRETAEGWSVDPGDRPFGRVLVRR